MLNKYSIKGISLSAAGLIALADLSTIAERTALTGSAIIGDTFLLAPGIHRQQSASEINGGEFPPTGALHSGYVFRVENQATVRYLQKIGKPGCLIDVKVENNTPHPLFVQRLRKLLSSGSIIASVFYFSAVVLTFVVVAILGAIHDFWAVGVLLMLMLSRFINMVLIKRRTQPGWKGASEPGVEGDLLVLVSQDRWVRMRGEVDDLKAVTAGQWLRDLTTVEGFATSFATLLVYVAACLANNASTIGNLFIATLMLVSIAFLGLCNSVTRDLQMFGRSVRVVEGPKSYRRRLDMANELIHVSGRDDWAISLGLILPTSVGSTSPKAIL